MSLRASPQRPPRPDSASLTYSTNSAAICVLSAATAVVLTLAAVHLYGLTSVEHSRTVPSLWAPQADCEPRTWRLQAQNWTDGDPTVQEAGICKWQAEPPELGCSASLGIPKVAMLFLTMGNMRHEALWAVWFKQAATRLPLDCLAAATCGIQQSKRAQTATEECLRAGGGILWQQSLFTVYTHTPPGFAPYGQESLFHGTEIANRINASWGTFDLVQVARNLMEEALQDPLNQRFITISESCIPLYAPQVIYHQLMFAEKSRINACTTRENFSRDDYRWTWRLEEVTNGHLKKGMWRKNHQWLGLTRKHARLVVADQELAPAFSKHCYSGQDPDFGGWWRTCFPDEHYFSTLLAFHGLDEETDCMGELTHTYWCQSCTGDERLHPKTYKAEEISVTLLQKLRQEEDGCDAAAANAAAQQFVPSLLDLLGGQRGRERQSESKLLAPKCPLFARKFTDDAPAVAMHAMFSLLLAEDNLAAQAAQVFESSEGVLAEAGSRNHTADLLQTDSEGEAALTSAKSSSGNSSYATDSSSASEAGEATVRDQLIRSVRKRQRRRRKPD